jgi:hypothetical protein
MGISSRRWAQERGRARFFDGRRRLDLIGERLLSGALSVRRGRPTWRRLARGRARNDARAKRGVRGEHAVVADERVAGRGNEGARASEKFDWRHQPVGLSAAASHLHLVSNPAVGQSRKPFECEAGAERVAAEFLAPLDVDGWDSDAGVIMAAFGDRRLEESRPSCFAATGRGFSSAASSLAVP